MKTESYIEGYETALRGEGMRAQEKLWYDEREYHLYKAGHKDGRGDWVECYSDGRYSVINGEAIRREGDFPEGVLFYAYLKGRLDELNETDTK
jgi:hypothetical protein